MNIPNYLKNLAQRFTMTFFAIVLVCGIGSVAKCQPSPPKNSKGEIIGKNSAASLIIERKWNGKWYPVTGKDKVVWVSQRIHLQARMSDGSTISNQNWSVPGNAFYDYNQHDSQPGAPTHAQPLSSFNQNAIYFIWRDRADNLNVRFSGVADGKPITPRGVNFRVRKPQFQMSGQIDGINWFSGVQLGDWSIATPPAGQAGVPPRGIVIMATKTSDWPGGGLLRFTQIARNRQILRYDTTLIHGRKQKITSGLDTNPEYPFTLSVTGTDFAMEDSPNSGSDNNTAKILYNAGFTTWLMFRTGESNSQWVPLRSIQWNAGGQATKPSNGAGAWPITGKTNNASPSAETTVFPEWDRKLDLTQWVTF